MKRFRSPAKSSGETSRSNTGLSVRKETISAPIPLAEDDEFPIRTPGSGIATPLGEVHERQIRPRDPPIVEQEDSPRESVTGIAESVDHAVELPPASTPSPWPIETVPESSPQPAEQQPNPRLSVGSVRSRSSIVKPQRKKSGFRSVLGKLFGRKRKGGASPQTRRKNSNEFAATQHRSDPTALNRSPRPRGSPQQRSASLPINEFNRALRSHSVVLDDFPLRDSYEPNRDSITADGTTRPRRATNPGRAWEPNRPVGYPDWTGLSPRPASSHDRGSKVITAVEGEDGVGLAISSHPNRRSRSLSELRGLSSNTVTRRRSDEIRYWRESYDPGLFSPLSSNKAEFEEETVPAEAPENVAEENAYIQPQPFNFGPSMSEIAGMKITQAASLETRVSQLEDRMLNIEKAVARLQFQSSIPIHFQAPPLRNPSRKTSAPLSRPATDNSEHSLPKHQFHRASPQRQARPDVTLQGSQNRSSSYGSSRPSTMSNNTYQPSFDAFPPHIFSSVETTGLGPPKTTRPLSTSTTIRGIQSSSPTVPKDGNLTAEHYTALNTMIVSEQESRQKLEAVVLTLQKQLHTVLAAGIAHRRQESEKTNEFSQFDHNESEDDEERMDFRTPNEERGTFEDEIFGAPLDNKDPSRTLSLSQITMAKSRQQQQQPSTNF